MPQTTTHKLKMPDASLLPFLLRLVDDKSPVVRAKVARELAAFGPRLHRDIEELGLSLSREQQELIDEITGQAPIEDDDAFRAVWTSWLESNDEHARLEEALNMLAHWQMQSQIETARAPSLASLLDELAADFKSSGRDISPQEMSVWLFSRAGRNLRGAAPDGVYNPQHSNLIYVIQERRGTPISLACVFILVGGRLGLEISGCNFPGHFLARARPASYDDLVSMHGEEAGRDLIFDCFNGGRVLSPGESAALRKAEPQAMTVAAPAIAIVARVLRNLVVAFEQTGSLDKARFMISLLSDLERVWDA